MSLADRVYNNNKPNRNKTETAEDRAYRLSRTYNNILQNIENVSDSKTFIQVRNEINSYAHETGKESVGVTRLNKMLNKRVAEVSEELQKSIDALNKQIQKIKDDRLVESVEHLQEVNTQAENRLLQFMMQLGTNRDGGTGNKRKVGNFVANADRADAIGLMKLATLPQFAQLFTTKQKEIILEKSKNPAELVFERNKEPLLKQKYSELGKAYMKLFNLRNVLKKIANTEKAYYFTKEQEE